MRRPTKRAAIIIAIAGLLALVATTAQAGWLFVLAAGVVGLLGASLVAPQGLRHLEIERLGPAHVVAGDPVTLTTTLRNNARSTTPPLRLEDSHPGLEKSALFVERAQPGVSLSATSTRIAPVRGAYEGGSIRVISGAPFGILSTKKAFQMEGSLIVLPRSVQLRNFPLQDATASPQELEGELARVGAGSEFVGLRTYRPGDPRRHVHWRSSARRGELVVREHQEEVKGPVVIAISGAEAGKAPDSAFEMLVSAAASIALYAQSMGHPLELVAPAQLGDAEPRRAVRPTRSAALEWLAGLQPVDASLQTLHAEAIGAAGRGSSIVFLATSAGAAGASLGLAARDAARRGARPVTVVADSSGWEEKAPAPNEATFVLSRGGDLRACLRG